MLFNEGKMPGGEAEKEKDGKREMSKQETEEMGGEMDEYYPALIEEAKAITEELKMRIDDERAQELRENLELIELQLGEDWEDFLDDIKSGEATEVKIDKEPKSI